MATDIFIAPASGVINFNNGIFNASPHTVARLQVFDDVSTGRLDIYNNGSGVRFLNRGVTGNVFEIFGDAGSLMTVSDDLSDSLLRVNDAGVRGVC